MAFFNCTRILKTIRNTVHYCGHYILINTYIIYGFRLKLKAINKKKWLYLWKSILSDHVTATFLLPRLFSPHAGPFSPYPMTFNNVSNLRTPTRVRISNKYFCEIVWSALSQHIHDTFGSKTYFSYFFIDIYMHFLGVVKTPVLE